MITDWNISESEFPENYENPSGKFCNCGKEMTIGESECFGTCFSCFDIVMAEYQEENNRIKK
jgi:hypothetical protein